MKNFKLLLLSFALLLFFVSCDEEGPTVIYGKITEYGSEKPIEGVAIYLTQGTSGGFGGASSYSALDSTHTDEDGNYRLEHDLTGLSGGFVVEFEHERYAPHHGRAVFQESHNYNEVLNPIVHILWHVKNVNPYNQFDQVHYSAEWGGGRSGEVHGTIGAETDFYDLDDNIGGNRNQKISIGVKRNDEWNYYYDTVYIPAHDTLLYEVFY